jgi:hypothetical protein
MLRDAIEITLQTVLWLALVGFWCGLLAGLGLLVRGAWSAWRVR